MKRNAILLVIDVLLLLAVVGLLLTGLLLSFVLPPGSGRLVVWSLGRHDWGSVHFWLAMAALGLAGVHLVLHWAWVCAVAAGLAGKGGTMQHAGRRAVIGGVGLLLLAGIVAGFLWAAASAVQPGEPRHAGGQGDGYHHGGR